MTCACDGVTRRLVQSAACSGRRAIEVVQQSDDIDEMVDRCRGLGCRGRRALADVTGQVPTRSERAITARPSA